MAPPWHKSRAGVPRDDRRKRCPKGRRCEGGGVLGVVGEGQ